MVNPMFIPYWGGTEKVIYEIGRRLSKKFEITVLTTKMKNTPKEEEIEGMRVVRTNALILNKLPHPLPPPYPIAPKKVKVLDDEAKKHRLVHFHNRFYYNPVDFFLVKRLKKTLVLTLHNARPVGIDPVTDFVGSAYDDTVGRVMMETCDYITAVSGDTLKTTVPEELRYKARVIYNGVDEKRFNPNVDRSKAREYLGISDEIMILSVARLVEQKGVKYLIDAMKGLDAKLVILGRGPKEKALRRKTKKLGLENKVIFVTDRIPEEMLPSMYTAADIFALPSLYEPFGLVAVEAMASGKPVVVSRVGGLKEIVTPDVGFLVEPRNPGDIASKLAILLSNPELRKEMGKNARRRVEENFTWDKIADDYNKFYDEVLE